MVRKKKENTNKGRKNRNQGVAIRTGHHCAMPVMEYFAIPGTARASLALYNNFADIDMLITALEKAKEIFA